MIMRLKSLTLSGFKSFPKRTIIHFPHGISAIVGPNGCGKSNIIDAIRWVLGEQSPSLLRAKQMGDLIFRGGNGTRAPASAYVKLVLENLGRLMPPELKELSEVEIERILFANGDAKYRLNGKNCRLKEIRYLFMDTGAGTRAYSIIDQGQVNEFVEMSPEERRFMVEEVAGISRYKARRSEAKRQMEETRLNLERLEDIIHEVERQMRSLKRQATKARRYMELKERARALEMGIIAMSLREKRHQAEELAKQEAGLRDDIEALEIKESELKLRVKKIGLDLEAVNSELGRKRARFHALKDEMASVQKMVQGLERREVDLGSRLNGIRKRLEEAEERKGGLKERLKEVEAHIEGLESELSEISKREKGHEERLEGLNVKMAALREVQEEGKGRLMDELARRAKVESEISRLEDRLQSLGEKMKRARSMQQELTQRCSRLEEERDRLKEAISGFKGQEGDLSMQIAGLEDEKRRIFGQLNELKEQIAGIERSCSELQVELSTLEALERAGAGLSEGEKALLSSDQGRDLRPLAESLKVKPGWEAVIEAALGALARSLVVEDLHRAKGLAQVVKEAGRGPAALVINELIEGSGDEKSDDKAASEKSLAYKAAALDSAGLAAIEQLKQCYFSEDIDSAEELLRRLRAAEPNRHYLVVTRDLQVITALGQVVLPSGLKAEDGLIYRRARMKELCTKLDALKKDLHAQKEEQSLLEDKLKGLERDIAQKNRLLKEAIEGRQGLERELNKLDIEKEKASNRLELLEFDLHEAEDEMEMAQKRLSKLRQELEEIEEREEGLRQDADRMEERMKELSATLSAARAELEGVRMEQARKRATLKEKMGLMNSLRQDIEETVSFGRRLASELSELEDELSACRSELTRHREAAKSLKEQEAAALKEVRGLEAEASRLQELFREKEARLRELRHQKMLLEEKKRGLMQQLSHMESAISSLEEELAVRFDTSSEGLRPEELLGGMDLIQASDELKEAKRRMDKMGSVNLAAIDDFKELEKRHGYLMEQKADLMGSLEDVEQAIDRIDRECTQKFKDALRDINESLSKVFPLLFDGGSARLEMTGQGDDIWETGIDYRLELPGKRIGHLGLLSGGEKALSALALIFAIFFIKPSPFCLLDEVDAPLDEANTERFNRLVKRIAANSQVVLVTHNQRVMEIADTLYGVTMEEKGVSKLVSVNLVEQARGKGGGQAPQHRT